MLDYREETTSEKLDENNQNPVIKKLEKNINSSNSHYNINSSIAFNDTLKNDQTLQNSNNENAEILYNIEKYEFLEVGDTESTYEDSFNQFHGYHKTIEIYGCELYKVTEYNESLECSVSEEAADLATKISDFSIKYTNSITDKFPKFSVASLSISDTSYQTINDTNKKSCLDYTENSDALNCTSPKQTIVCQEKDLKKQITNISVNITNSGETNTLKQSIETITENCSCSNCGVF
ncbi:hypothetical protein SteCoe_21367 [Stentor coeruleus]|uniref:Uncharacterized protein n=1 Tax=Stentor coeruleus TaxID=5963 RepID=A0A1R2BPW2_9CILI|nr:hypothetical protein SteCoe_21367 [Stentor coeruleus]